MKKTPKHREGPNPDAPRPGETREAYEARLVLENQRLVRYIAKRTAPALPLEDKIQEGMIGLIRSASRYDPTRGVRFGAYAQFLVQRLIQKMGRAYGTPMHVTEEAWVAARALAIQARDREATGARSSNRALARETGLTEARVADLLALLASANPRDPEKLDTFAYASAVSAPAIDPEVAVEVRDHARWVQGLLGRLIPSHRFVIGRYFGLYGAEPQQLHTIAKELGVTRVRAAQLFAAAMARLRMFVFIREKVKAD